MRVKVFTTVNFWAFQEVMAAFVHSFKELGYEADYALDEDFPIVSWGDINVGIIGQKAFDPTKELPKQSFNILFQVEELWNDREYDSYRKSNGWDLVLELYYENTMITRGTKNVVWFPMGWSPAFEYQWGEPPGESEPDIYFFGSMTDRRKTAGSQIAQEIPSTVFDEMVYGRARDETIMRAKININVKAHPKWSYAPVRCLLIQCKKKFLLIERPDGRISPFRPYKHYYWAENVPTMIEMAKELLDRPNLRHEQALAAYEDLRRNHKFTDYLQWALKGKL